MGFRTEVWLIPSRLCNPNLFYSAEQCKKMFPKINPFSFLGVQFVDLIFMLTGDEFLFHYWSFNSLLELLILFSRCLRFTVYRIKI